MTGEKGRWGADPNKVAARTRGGVSFAGLLTCIFVAGKITGLLDWSWVWIAAPLWLPWAILPLIVGVLFTIIFVAELVKTLLGR